MGEKWLDVMPAIPLARAVPVVDSGDRRRVVCAVDGDRAWLDGAPSPWNLKRPGPDDGAHYAGDLRVDLDDPQGFAYALRYALECSAPLGLLCGGNDQVAFYVFGLITRGPTDADRLALAQAIAEVTRG